MFGDGSGCARRAAGLSPDERDERDAGPVADAGGAVAGAGGSVAGGAGRAAGDAGAAAVTFVSGADPAVLAALTSLAGRTRELVEAVVLSDAAIAELGAVAAEIGDLTARLAARRRSAPIRAEFDAANGQLLQPHSPVTGQANPLAPPISIVTTPEGTARAEFVLGHVYEGPPDAVHGGVCAAILDHLLGFAAAAGARPGMTAALSLRYLRPTPVGAPLVAEAWISGVDGNATTVHGRICNERGAVTVEANGEFVLPRRWRLLAQRGDGPAAAG
jgi:uncharacterized protein (TIGR00369 family)